MPRPNGTVTLEEAWRYLMSNFAYRNPGMVTQGRLANRALDSMIRRRAKGR